MEQASNKTKFIKVRVTEDEYNHLKERASKFNGKFSTLIRLALKDFGDMRAKDKFDFIDEYIRYWKEHDLELRRIGANLNQSVKRVNELALVGKMTKEDAEILLQEMLPIRELLFEYLDELEKTTKHKLSSSRRGRPRKG